MTAPVVDHAEIPDRRHRHRVVMWHVGQWDAPVYFAFVAAGIPIMSLFVADMHAKIWVAMCFMALTPFYWWIELEELRSQLAMRGLLEPREIDSQRKSMQLLDWGVAVAVVVQCFAWIGGWRGPFYGPIEWFLIAHTVAVGWTSMSVIYPLMDEYLQATSSQRRFEDQTH